MSKPIPGSADLNTQIPGGATTVSGAASASGGISGGNLIQSDIDKKLFQFRSEDTALMSLMLLTEAQQVDSPEVDHYMIDEERGSFATIDDVTPSQSQQFPLPLGPADQNIPRVGSTLLCRGVDGYNDEGNATTPGKDLMLFVKGISLEDNCPIVVAINGPKANKTDMVCQTPEIPAGTEIKLLANAMYETQKGVDPDLVIPQPETIYLQKRGMNQVFSDYFNDQLKRVPWTQRQIAEAAILNFKRRTNRTLWAGRKGKITVSVPKLGEQFVYFTEGIRWQFRRELQHSGAWTIEQLIALTKMFYTGEDVPKSGTLLAGKNLLEALQCIDYSSHPEIQIIPAINPVGWSVTRIHTVFGDIDIKREPTLDALGWSNSGALLGEGRLSRYIYSPKHEFSDRVEGEEATRKGIIEWDGLALKGACHIWLDGEGNASNPQAVTFKIWSSTTAPVVVTPGFIFYLTVDCPGISVDAKANTMWTSDGKTWSEFTGQLYAQ